MLKHIYLILIATFIFGFIVGFILWLFNNTGGEADTFKEAVSQELSVTAHAYGGCEQSGCASYRIVEDGTFTYILRQQNATDIRNEGKMPKEDIKRLRSLFTKTDFDTLSSSRFSGTCPIAYDGLGYRYTIEFNGKSYSLDSCKESLDGELLFEDLKILFRVLQGQNRTT